MVYRNSYLRGFFVLKGAVFRFRPVVLGGVAQKKISHGFFIVCPPCLQMTQSGKTWGHHLSLQKLEGLLQIHQHCHLHSNTFGQKAGILLAWKDLGIACWSFLHFVAGIHWSSTMRFITNCHSKNGISAYIILHTLG